MTHILGSAGVDPGLLVIVTESNGRQIMGYADSAAGELSVGPTLIKQPLQIAEQVQQNRVNTQVAPIFHGMLVEEIMVNVSSMIRVTERSKFRELYTQSYEKIMVNIRAAEAGLIAPEGNGVVPGARG